MREEWKETRRHEGKGKGKGKRRAGEEKKNIERAEKPIKEEEKYRKRREIDRR